FDADVGAGREVPQRVAGRHGGGEGELGAVASGPGGTQHQRGGEIAGRRIPDTTAPSPARGLACSRDPDRTGLSSQGQSPGFLVRRVDDVERLQRVTARPRRAGAHGNSACAALPARRISGAGTTTKNMETKLVPHMMACVPPPMPRSKPRT